MSGKKKFTETHEQAANIMLARGENWVTVAKRFGVSRITLRRYCNPELEIDEALRQFASDMKLLGKRLESMPGVWRARAVDVLGAAEILHKWSERCDDHSKPN